MSEYKIPRMRSAQDIRMDVSRIVKTSSTAAEAASKVMEVIKDERDTMISEMAFILDPRDPDYNRIHRHLADMRLRNKG